MEGTIVAGFEQCLSPAGQGAMRRAAGSRRKFTLDEVRCILRQDAVILAHLMDGTSPLGEGLPVASGWRQDGDHLARQVMHGLNTLQDDENGLTLVIACAGAYMQGRMDHLMIWNIWVEGNTAKLQVGNQENIGGRHYPTGQANTVELWQRYDPAGARNSNAPGVPVDAFAATPVGISLARHGLFINLFACAAAENFAPALALLSATEAGQRFGYFDGQKSCFTTARDLLGATRTKGPQGALVDWGAGRPQPVVPEILNQLSLLTNNERQVGVETACGQSWDLNDPRVRQQVGRDKVVFATLAARLGRWINRKPGAYAAHIRPAAPRLS